MLCYNITLLLVKVSRMTSMRENFPGGDHDQGVCIRSAFEQAEVLCRGVGPVREPSLLGRVQLPTSLSRRLFVFTPLSRGGRGVVFESRERRAAPAPAFPRIWRYPACARAGQNRAREREEFRWTRARWTFTGQSRRTRRFARAELLKNTINSRGFSINS